MPKNLQILSLVAFLYRRICSLQIYVKFRMIIIGLFLLLSVIKHIIFITIILLVTNSIKKQCDDNNTTCNNFDQF